MTALKFRYHSETQLSEFVNFEHLGYNVNINIFHETPYNTPQIQIWLYKETVLIGKVDRIQYYPLPPNNITVVRAWALSQAKKLAEQWLDNEISAMRQDSLTQDESLVLERDIEIAQTKVGTIYLEQFYNFRDQFETYTKLSDDNVDLDETLRLLAHRYRAI